VYDRHEAWRNRIMERRAPEPSALGETLAFARRFSWLKLGERMHEVLQDAPEIVLPRVA